MNIPLYKKLHLILREHIITGLYKEGDILPSENELCITHHVTRPTVRQALDELVREGYIRKHKGNLHKYLRKTDKREYPCRKSGMRRYFCAEPIWKNAFAF